MLKQMTLFTVIIPTYNRNILVRKAIDSVLNQNFQDYNLIVIDDGSTDNTPSIEKDYKNKIKYIRISNSGVSFARNLGIEHSNSKYITFLDSDDQWLPDKLMEHKKFILDNPDIKIHQSEEIWFRDKKRVNPKFKHKKKKGNIFIDSLDLCLISPSSVAMDSSLFKKYGLFDIKMAACEDYDLWLRITAKEKVGLITKALNIRYGGHADQLSKKFLAMDRFRIYSIIKTIQLYGNELKKDYYKNAHLKLIEKSQILLNGAIKRNRNIFIKNLENLIEDLYDEDYNNIDYHFLLEEEDFY